MPRIETRIETRSRRLSREHIGQNAAGRPQYLVTELLYESRRLARGYYIVVMLEDSMLADTPRLARTRILSANHFSERVFLGLMPPETLIKSAQREVLMQIRTPLAMALDEMGGRSIALAERIDHLDALIARRI